MGRLRGVRLNKAHPSGLALPRRLRSFEGGGEAWLPTRLSGVQKGVAVRLASLELYQRHQSPPKNVTIVVLVPLAAECGGLYSPHGRPSHGQRSTGGQAKTTPRDRSSYRAAKSGTKSHVLLIIRRLDALSYMYTHYS